MFLVRGVMGDFLELLPIVVFFALCAAMLVDQFRLDLFMQRRDQRAVEEKPGASKKPILRKQHSR